jgi:hypothetical protein
VVAIASTVTTAAAVARAVVSAEMTFANTDSSNSALAATGEKKTAFLFFSLQYASPS